jgi:hypothetical protein
LLKWDVLQAENDEKSLPETEERTFNGPLAHRKVPQRNGSKLEEESSLSDPDSWVWKEKKDAKFAIAIDTTKGIIPDVSRGQALATKRNVLTHDGAYLALGKPKEILWLDRVESTYPLCSSRL